MSMLWAWDRILGERDRVEREIRDEDQAREELRATDDDPPTRRCRVCAHEGPERFCPHCLADTMIDVKRPRPPAP